MSNQPFEPLRPFDEADRLATATIRMLAADMVQKANSGHPGGPMSLADFAYVLWTRFLRHDPSTPAWPDRDRFVLSGGHCSALLYAMLGLFGYLPEEEWKRFRQVGSHTPGHPEVEIPGVETTTGPLGQGFANAVGMAIAERLLRAEHGDDLVGHRVFVTMGDGDVQEGISSEAAALAGHLRLGRLIAFFDDNRVQIDGCTHLVTSENVGARFAAQGWHVLHVDGHDLEALAAALAAAAAEEARPSLIVGRTHIADGTATRADDHNTHGAPLGEEEIRASKEKLGLPPDAHFHVPDSVRERFAEVKESLVGRAGAWAEKADAHPAGPALTARMRPDLRPTLPAELPVFPADAKGMATRKASGAFLKAVVETAPELVGGAADLAGSIQTSAILATGELGPSETGRGIHFGVREHAMASISNGLALHGGLVPFCGTFLVFADYMKPAIRLAALMGLRVVYVFTHDSFHVGEDGPTHQPVDQLAMLRAIPGLTVLRPADANETIAAWHWALSKAEGPVALSLTRQNLPVLDRNEMPAAEEIERGGYVLRGGDTETPDIALVASGSEVSLCLDAADVLESRGHSVRVVNMASWELFEAQPEVYRDSVLPTTAPVRLVVEAAASQGWQRYAGPLGAVHGFDRFGASGPGAQLAKEFGYTTDEVVARAEALIAAAGPRAALLKAALERLV